MTAIPPTPADAPTDPFVHLHTHTEYSLLDGAARIGELVETARRMGQPAVAITDHGVLYGAVEFTTAARTAGIKPIIGCEMYMAPRSRHDKEGKADRDPNHLVLIARDLTGYRNLVRLVSRSHLEGHYYKPRIDKELLAAHAEGLTCLSACIGGELPQAILRGDMDAAESVARQHMEIFGPDNYLLEIQDHGIPEETEIRAGLLEMARRTGLPLVCTNDSHYIRSEDAEPHDILLCLQTGARRQEEKRFRFHGPHFYITDGAEMRRRFADYGEAVANTLAVAERCTLELTMGKTLLPQYQPIPEGLDADSYLRELCERGLRERYGEPTREARERLAMELDVIGETGFAAYFLIVWDFIRAARCDGVKVGPGRGSAAGSLVSYVLRITDICPLKYGLIFERFLNRERVSMPDIDIDFDDRRRDRVIEYVQEKYGRDRVAQIITFGTMAARAAIRDVGRVLDVPLGDVDRLAKLVPPQIGITLEKALASRELREVYDNEPWAKTVIDNARRLEGICRNASTHAAGVVIAPEPLENIVPLQRSTNERDAMVTQFDMNGVQTVGLLKMDFLGLTNLTVIEAAVENVRQTTGIELDIDNLPLDDPATYALLGRADTLGVFQLEAVGGKKILLDMQPQTLDDISTASALNRPGPIEGGLIDLYMKRKRGEEPVEYLLPELEPILADTHGVIVYQDQVMKIASAVAGFTLGEADILRAAMGKKDKAKMAQQREKFLAGAAARSVDPGKAEELFDLMAYFAGYGFNKCLNAQTVVVDALTGERATVESLFKRRRPFVVHGLGEDGRLRPRRISDVMFNGTKPIYEVRTVQGRRIRATSRHRFRVFDGWRRLSELRVGDALATPRRLPVECTSTWPDHELVVLAGLLAEGNTCHPTCLYFFNNDRVLIDDFTAAATQFPRTVARIYTRPTGRMEVCLSTGGDYRFKPGQRPWNAVDGSAALIVEDAGDRCGAYEWAQSLGILGVRATGKRVPEEVFGLSDANLELFLGRLWAGDGFVANATSHVPFYATSSAQLATDVRDLLLRLGITSGVHEKSFRYRGGVRPGYTVNLFGDGSVRGFLDRVGPHCLGREGAIAELRAFLGDVDRRITYRDTVPTAVYAWIDEERRRKAVTWAELQRRARVSLDLYASRSGRQLGYRRSTIARLAEALDSKRLSDVASSDVLWDRIVDIEQAGVEDTYDLTVETDHNFVADGFVVHNSHSISYALISYQTAYLKANHPLEYMTALLNSKAGDFDKLKQAILDSHARGLVVRPPDVNRSGTGFVVGDPEKREILYGLSHIKNVGEKVVENLLVARDEGGAFTSLLDLCLRTGGRDLNRRVLEALVRSGACDSLGDRATLLALIDRAMDRAAQVRREREQGQTSLFGLPSDGEGDGGAPLPAEELAPVGVVPAAEEDRLRWERELLGMYLSDHPLRRVADTLRTRVDTAIGELGPHLDGLVVQVGGSVREVRTVVPRRSSTGQRMAFLQIEDMSGSCEVVVFARTFEECAALLHHDAVVVVRGKVEAQSRGDDEERGGEPEPAKIIAEAVFGLDDARLLTWRRNATVHLTLGGAHVPVLGALRETLEQHPGDAPVVLHVELPEKVDQVSLAEGFGVDPGPPLERAVSALLGDGAYRVELRRERAAPRDPRRPRGRNGSAAAPPA